MNLLDRRLIVSGGRALRDAGHIHKGAMDKAVQERVMAKYRRELEVESSAMGEAAGALEAASLILHNESPHNHSGPHIGFRRGRSAE